MDRIVQFGMSVNRMGSANMSGLTQFQDAPGYHQTAPEESAAFSGDTAAEGGQPAAILAGIILALLALWMVRQNMPSGAEVMGVNLFNLATVGLTAVAFIALGKVTFSRFPVPGFTPLFASL